MTHNEENNDDRLLYEVTKEQLEQRLWEIWHGPKSPPFEVDEHWEHKVRVYSFLYRVNPEHAERWAKATRYMAGYRD